MSVQLKNQILELTKLIENDSNIEKKFTFLKTEYDLYERNKLRKVKYELEIEKTQIDIDTKQKKLDNYEKNKKKLEENQKIDKEKQEAKKPTTMYNFKKYNANASNSNINKPSKNRVQSDFVLPPQIKANLPNVNSSGEKQLLKESSNRYTWEGRIANLTLLKSVDKKKAMSFADFKLLRK